MTWIHHATCPPRCISSKQTPKPPAEIADARSTCKPAEIHLRMPLSLTPWPTKTRRVMRHIPPSTRTHLAREREQEVRGLRPNRNSYLVPDAAMAHTATHTHMRLSGRAASHCRTAKEAFAKRTTISKALSHAMSRERVAQGGKGTKVRRHRKIIAVSNVWHSPSRAIKVWHSVVSTPSRGQRERKYYLGTYGSTTARKNTAGVQKGRGG